MSIPIGQKSSAVKIDQHALRFAPHGTGCMISCEPLHAGFVNMNRVSLRRPAIPIAPAIVGGAPFAQSLRL